MSRLKSYLSDPLLGRMYWIMINMRKHLGSKQEFADWLSTMFAFYVVNRLVDFESGLNILHAAQVQQHQSPRVDASGHPREKIRTSTSSIDRQ